MKTLYIKIFLLSITVAYCFLLSTCQSPSGTDSPCPIPDTSLCTLYYGDLAKFPYHLHDTIKLQSDASIITYNFILNNIDTGYTLHQLPTTGCPGNFERWQYINKTFSCSSYQYPLIISHSLIECNSCKSFIYFDKYGSFKKYCAELSSPPYDLNQIIINGKSYTNIYKFIMQYDTTQYALYNTVNGVLQIISNGKTWNIVQ